MKRAGLVVAVVLVAWLAIAQQHAEPRPMYQISGTAVNSVTGAPVRGAKVSISNVLERDQRREVTTSETGQFSFDNVAPGKYALTATGRGFRPQFFEQHEGGFSSAIVVGAGKQSTGILFRVQPEATISGQVIGIFNEPVQDGQAYLFYDAVENGTRTIRYVRQTALDDEGEYQFKHLPPGKFYVAVVARPWFAMYAAPYMQKTGMDPAGEASDTDALLDTAYAVTYYGDVLDPSAAVPIITRPGHTVTANLTLTPVRAAHVAVNTGAGDPSKVNHSITVQQTLLGGFEVPVSTSYSPGRDGRVDVTGLPPGHYKLTVHEYHYDTPGTQPRQPTSHTREIEAGADGEVAMGDGPITAATVSGILQLDNGAVKPPGNAMVQMISRSSRQGYAAKLKPDGQFSFDEPIQPGKYEVWVANVPREVLRGIAAKGATVAGREITVANGTTDVKLAIVASRGVGTVTGTAITEKGPMAGAMIVLVPEHLVKNSFAIRRDQSDSDGTFTLGAVVPGRYTVLALRNGWDMEWNNPDVLRQFLRRGTSVVVQEKSEQDIKVHVQ